jgi:hypothetical protein
MRRWKPIANAAGVALIGADSDPRERRTEPAMKTIALAVAIPILLVGLGYGVYRYHYPYGYKHCCLKILGSSLIGYAEAHGGRFPSGAGCPEASLSLLNRWDHDIGAETLCGKTVPEEVTKQVLDRGELLGADNCDWHYVEGLTLADDPRLALVWDKIGLGHDSQRPENGGHSVFRLSGHEEVVPESEWSDFLNEQEHFLAARSEAAKKGHPVLVARIRLPSGAVVDNYDGPFTLSERWRNGLFSSGTGSSSGGSLTSVALRWWHLSDGTIEYTLKLANWVSKPVVVRISDGKASPESIIFEMR